MGLGAAAGELIGSIILLALVGAAFYAFKQRTEDFMSRYTIYSEPLGWIGGAIAALIMISIGGYILF